MSKSIWHSSSYSKLTVLFSTFRLCFYPFWLSCWLINVLFVVCYFFWELIITPFCSFCCNQFATRVVFDQAFHFTLAWPKLVAMKLQLIDSILKIFQKRIKEIKIKWNTNFTKLDTYFMRKWKWENVQNRRIWSAELNVLVIYSTIYPPSQRLPAMKLINLCKYKKWNFAGTV